MPTIEDRIKDQEDLLHKTIPNKHTMKSIVTLKANIAKLRRELVKELSSKGGGGVGFSIKRSGDAQVAFVGFPSSGKSTLLNILTEGHTDSKVAAYDFTTVDCIPGTMKYNKITLQLLDLPGIILGASHGKGRGREILSVLRGVDLILIILDFDYEGKMDLKRLDIIKSELYKIGIRINRKPPKIGIKILPKGGVGVTSSVRLTQLNRDYVKTICQEESISNAHITFYEDASPEDLIDALLGNCQYIPACIVVNKIDIATPEEKERLFSGELLGGEDFVPVSGITMEGIDDLRKKIYEKIGLMRIYLKPRVKEIDFEKPLILRQGATIQDACAKIHKDFVNQFRFAKVWGKSAKHPGQVVQIKHVLEDEDILCIFLRK